MKKIETILFASVGNCAFMCCDHMKWKKFDMKNKWRNNRKKTKNKSNDIFTSAYNTTAIKKFIN